MSYFDWVTFFSGFGLAALLGVLVNIWLGTRMKHDYDKKLEEHKAGLQKEVEQYKLDLGMGHQKTLAKINTDKELFIKFLDELPSNGSIQFLKTNNFAGIPFEGERLDQCRNFLCNWNDAIHEFLDSELEEKRKFLLELIEHLLVFLYSNVWPLKGTMGLYSVPPEWKETQPERFGTVVKQIDDLAEKIVSTYDELVRMAHSKLTI